MNRAWKLLLKPDFYFLFLVVIVTFLAARSLLFQPGYFNMHDDLQMMRQLQLEKCFQDGQIPCRWVPDMGYGYGYPLFNFYPQLPYLIGQVFRVVGLSFVTTVKLTFALSFILSGIFMYLLGKEMFGRLGGLLAAVFYTWAPYHSVDIYVRGAMNEAWAIVWYPAIFWASYKLVTNRQRTKDKVEAFQGSKAIKKLQKLPRSLSSIIMTIISDTKWIVTLALFWFAILNSHNLMVMIFAPFFLVWLLIITWQNDAWEKIPSLGLSGLWAFGLSAFFTLPVLFEQKYTWVEKITEGYYNYSVHFVNIRQLLVSRFWDYGPSTWLDEDRMSFQIGHLHWIISIFVGLGIAAYLFTKRKKLISILKTNRFILPTILLIGVGWFSAFMTHSRSTPIWQAFEPIQFLQFPWRFLTVTIFAFSFVLGALPALFDLLNKEKNILVKFANKWMSVSLVFALSLVLIVWNWNYFTPENGSMGPLADEEKFTGVAWEKQQTAGIFDYLPLTADTAPKEQKEEVAVISDGKGSIINGIEGTDWVKFDANIESESSIVRINILDFPEWRVFSANQEIDKFIPEQEEWGRFYIELPQGEHEIYAQLFNTQIRTVSNILSAFSWIILLVVVVNRAFGGKLFRID